MKDKEMIEEMAKEAFAHCNECKNGCEKCEQDREERPFCNYKCKAKHLVKQGWIKLPKDSVVLSREEYEKVKTNNFSYGVEQGYKSGVLDGRKETAEKFANFVKSKLFDLGNIVNERDIDDMLKEFLNYV